MNNKDATDIELYKNKLRDHLLTNTISQLGGRDGVDMIGSPRRKVFTGVLASRFVEDRNFQDKQQTSSIGFDFKVKLPKENKVKIIIKVKWCFYYAVFPSWDMVERHNVSGKDSEVQSSSKIAILPVAFRRLQVMPDEIVLGVDETKTNKVYDLSDDISRVKQKIDSDPDRWRHLDEPKKQERRLNMNAEWNEDTYKEALSNIKNSSTFQSLPDWNLTMHIDSKRDIANPEIIRVKVLLSNNTIAYDKSVEDPKLDERYVYDAEVEVKVVGGEIIPFEFLLAERDYRSIPRMSAKGINCVVLQDDDENRLRTETLPVYSQPLYRTRENTGVPFESLDTDDCETVLDKISESMSLYLHEWDKYLPIARNELSESSVNNCKKDRDNFEHELEGFKLGIQCLRSNQLLKKAFKLMNRAFTGLGNKSGGKIHSWRLFQICFIVSQLPGLLVRVIDDTYDEKFKDLVFKAFNKASVLWFPTGGGKTEAYLGLIATALIFDRLRGKTRGVNTWMRFPLRMLSLQQMERLSRVIAELNILRDSEVELQNGDPFSIGYYVGNTVTPNRVNEMLMNDYSDREENRKKVLLLRKCPYCGAKTAINTDKRHWRILHKCTNESCFSNNAKSLGDQKGALPLYVVDNEIYRYLPSVLVGTVDKLAIAGFNQNFANIIKGVKQKCPDHGYTSYDTCIEQYASGCKNNKVSDLIKLEPVHDPGPSLLIQDEMHLLKSDLGVFNGHYEGYLQYVGNKVWLPPKVLAATATIEAYDQHAFHLYLKDSDRFPVPSWKKGESFYATSTPLEYRRKYIGILCHTQSVVDASSRVLYLYQNQIKKFSRNYDKVRVVLENSHITDEDIQKILTLYDFSLAYVNKKSVGSNLLDRVEQYNIDFEYEGLSKIRHDLLTGDRNPEDIGNTLDRIESERDGTIEQRLNIVAATSLISHGVDLERINMMTICGMPSHYAEYVQSSSRSSRSHPGIVFTCFLSKDIRELSQYEMFMPMHENMDNLIEPVAVNRFSSFAPNKTVPGLLSALLINDISPDLYKSDIKKPLTHVPTLKVALGLQSMGSSGTNPNCIDVQQLLAALEEIIGTTGSYSKVSDKELDNIRQRIEEILQDQIAMIGRSPENKLNDILSPLTSFRDVDEGLEFESLESSAIVNRI
ncbi:MAG: hypothetical protein H6756_02590 [Candidatus Omnitrophica bacterium]|nr:hypothetical protein [Candidatus Omnitrophota bacterium]